MSETENIRLLDQFEAFIEDTSEMLEHHFQISAEMGEREKPNWLKKVDQLRNSLINSFD